MVLNDEGVMDGRVKGEKSLRRPLALETLHLAFSSPGRLMRIFRPVLLHHRPV
jgi:hypothetical protein